jgi:hypothetical protein
MSEKYMILAITASDNFNEKFLTYFEKNNKIVYDNYIKLNENNNTLDDFKSNPVVFILANEPRCCFYIAKNFVELEFPLEFNNTNEKEKEKEKDYEELMYQEYKRLKGRKQKKSYLKYNEIFVKHTFNGYMGQGVLDEPGEPEIEENGNFVYYSTEDSINGFMKATKQNRAETNRIFHSIDNISGYT